MLPAVTANQIDVAIVTDANIALIGYVGYGDARIIGSIRTNTDDAIVARRDAGILKHPKDDRRNYTYCASPRYG